MRMKQSARDPRRSPKKIMSDTCDSEDYVSESEIINMPIVTRKPKASDANGKSSKSDVGSDEDDDTPKTMQSELKYLEKRYDKKGSLFVTEYTGEMQKHKINWWERYALCITVQLNRTNDGVRGKSLQVNSQCLKDLLASVIPEYPGISFKTKKISIPFPPRCLYHYRHEIRRAASKFEIGSTDAEHAKLLTDIIEDEFKDTISEVENLEGEHRITYEHLWTIFRPGCIVYSDVSGQPRAFQLRRSENVTGRKPGFLLTLEYVDYDGEIFGTSEMSMLIPSFIGDGRITELTAFPIAYHENKSEAQTRLITRGRKFESLTGQNFLTYKGIAVDFEDRPGKHSVDGRVMIDCKTTVRRVPGVTPDITDFKAEENNVSAAKRRRLLGQGNGASPISADVPAQNSLTDDQCMIANATVLGFDFNSKKFFHLLVDPLKEIEWDSACFSKLVLPEAQKETVKALVHTHSQVSCSGGFDDIVKGKGKGLVLVLHGPPGVGKTLTAECVAEFSKRPLYVVSSGDLGTGSQTLDARLSEILDLASTWKAVLLIDEADVFLERRSSHDLQRNSLISIFLRVLEYYEGILFLTTNRVQSFDEAFKSRIHVPVKYSELSKPSRKAIWKNFLHGVESGMEINEKDFDALSESPLNGRQIKNVVRTAASLAQYNNKKLDQKQLQQVLKIQIEFDSELEMGKWLE